MLDADTSSTEETYKKITLGANTGFWSYYNGIATVHFSVPDVPNIVAIFKIIPINYSFDRSASVQRTEAVALMYNDEVRALLGAVAITPSDAIPAPVAEFSCVRDVTQLVESGKACDWGAPTEDAEYFESGEVYENDTYSLKAVGVERYDYVHDTSKKVVTYLIEFTNNGDKAICLANAMAVEGYQTASCTQFGDTNDRYVPVNPGQTLMVRLNYILNEPWNRIVLKVGFKADNGDGTYTYPDDNDITKIIIVEAQT